MSTLVLFNKPFNILSQFRPAGDHITLQRYLKLPGFHPAGRLDKDSEGLLLLTDDGALQHRIADPGHKAPKSYWVQVEGEITDAALRQLERGIVLNDGITAPAGAKRIIEPANLWPRTPPIRVRKQIPDSWIELTITEGRNRQVRRMTAATGFPTLRLIRHRIGEYQLDGLQPGEFKQITVSG